MIRNAIARLITCRRSILAIVGMGCCTAISIRLGVDTSGSIAAICMGVAGANAAQAAMSSKKEAPVESDR